MFKKLDFDECENILLYNYQQTLSQIELTEKRIAHLRESNLEKKQVIKRNEKLVNRIV